MTRMEPKKSLTVAEAAKKLSCSQRTVYRLIARQAISSIKLGYRTVRISELELESFIQRGGRLKRRRGKGSEWLERAYRPDELPVAYAKVTEHIRRQDDEVEECTLEFRTQQLKTYVVRVRLFPDVR